MNFKCLVLSVAVVALAGCGSATITSTPASGNPSNPSPATAITVNSPAAGASVSSPFSVSASANACQSQTISSIGYSVDQGTTTQVTGGTLQAQVTATAGAHILHVLAWGNNGASCSSDVAITVSATPPVTTTSGPSIPSNAITVTEIQQLSTWRNEFDSGSGSGSASGAMALVTSPSLSGSALRFDTTFANGGGERYHVSFGTDTIATHFVYDGWLYLAAPSDSIANVELDMNQVLTNGQTIIYGFQCDGYSNTWDLTENAGTPTASKAHWIHTAAACNPQTWSSNAWHHVQIAFSHDDAGNVTYQSVWFDGAEHPINQTVPSAFSLGWASVLLTNFQIDGRGTSGSNTVYLDNLSVSRW